MLNLRKKLSYKFYMNKEEFNYDLPKYLIAQEPAKPKSASKLFIPDINKITFFNQLTNYLDCDNVVVFNNTKVIPAVIEGRKDDRIIKITLNTKNKRGYWTAFAKPAKKINKGDKIHFKNRISAKVHEKRKQEVIIKFNQTEKKLLSFLIKHGSLPLPPYIKSFENKANLKKNYQTSFAKKLGSFACPTAGLHFDEKIFHDFKKKNINIINITLHVGAGTFFPLEHENISDNVLHKEMGIISKAAAEKITKSINKGKKIVAVGTTVTRLLEACYLKYGCITEFKEEIDLFIKPGFNFKVVDKLITNFHLPKSSLLILVSAFAGKDKILSSYSTAIRNKMRFYSYGDAMLLSRK